MRVRRAFVFAVVALLINVPVVHSLWVDHQITSQGREVVAQVVRTQGVKGDYFVDYRLPRAVDPRRTTYGGRVDQATFGVAQQTQEISVRVVPGHPNRNRPDGSVTSHLFLVIALITDLLLVAVLLLVLARGRRWRHKRVERVEGDLVTLSVGEWTLTCTAPPRWAARVSPGARAAGQLHLVAQSDLVPGVPVVELTQREESVYFVRGQVVDLRREQVDLDLGGLVLPVSTAGRHNRADLRDHAEVTGALMFTPSFGG